MLASCPVSTVNQNTPNSGIPTNSAQSHPALGFFDVDERLKELSAKGDDLERLNAIVDFEIFRADLEGAVPRSDRSNRPLTKSLARWLAL